MGSPVICEDLYQFRFLSDLKAAPDGRHAVFTVTQAQEEENGYAQGLWLMELPGGKARQLTAGKDEKGTFWLDGETLVFSSARGGSKDRGQSAWYQISLSGGEAEPYLELEGKVQSLKRLADGRFLFVENRTVQEAADEELCWVFDELPFWFNAKGVVNKKRAVLRIRDEKSHETLSLTKPLFQTESVAVSPDGQRFAWCGQEYENAPEHCNELYLEDLEGVRVKVELPYPMEVSNLYFWGNEQLFFTGQTYEWPGRSPRFFVYHIDSRKAEELPFQDGAPSSTVGTDAVYGAGEQFACDEQHLYFLKTDWGSAGLYRMDTEGTVRKVSTQEGQITSFALSEGRIYMTAMRDMRLAEVYALDPETGEEVRLSGLNDAYLREREISAPQRFTFSNRDGAELEGFVLKPRNYEPGKKYPGVLEMHGGPKVVFGSVFHHEMQCLASSGYFVFYTNPRGSDGRGEDFANLTQKLGTVDYEDFMDFTDEVLKRFPDIDEKRVGICGGSYAGFMCNWMIGHTDRFAAAVSQRSISSYLTKSLCTDIGFSHNMAQLGTDPWNGFDTVWNTSPLQYAPQAVTPTLFIQSDEDYRCWMSDAVQMFTALEKNGTDTRMVLFHGENHDLSRSGKPKNRIHRLKELLDWFAKYLCPEV